MNVESHSREPLVTLTDQQVIQLAYQVKELLEEAGPARYGPYPQPIKALLQRIDPQNLARHLELVDFYRMGHPTSPE